MATPAPTPLFAGVKVVAYRTGGWMNAEWHRSDATVDGAQTRQRVNDIESMGYKTRVFGFQELEELGLPVGFCRHADPITGYMPDKKCKCV